jgi:hypothetical protein
VRALVVVIVLVAACGANAPAIEKAETSCLDAYGPEIAQAFLSATPSGEAMGVVLSVEALACVKQALGAKVKPPADAGIPPG